MSGETKAVDGPKIAYDSRAPWWWNAAVAFLVKVALPVVILICVLGFFIWERVTVVREYNENVKAIIKIVERVVPVLERLERKEH